jgi:hypothetical protein
VTFDDSHKKKGVEEPLIKNAPRHKQFAVSDKNSRSRLTCTGFKIINSSINSHLITPSFRRPLTGKNHKFVRRVGQSAVHFFSNYVIFITVNASYSVPTTLGHLLISGACVNCAGWRRCSFVCCRSSVPFRTSSA